jgi:hypothetical protein
MKKLVFFALLFVGCNALAQSSAKRDPLYSVEYEFELQQPGSAIAISAYKSPSERDKTLVLKASARDCNGFSAVRVRLSNGDNLILDQSPISCSAYAPGRPNVSANVLLTPELQQQLDGQEIVEYTIGNVKTAVKYKEPYENLASLLKLVRDEQGF